MCPDEQNRSQSMFYTHITIYRSFAFNEYDIKPTFYGSIKSKAAHIAQFVNVQYTIKLIKTDKMVKAGKLDDWLQSWVPANIKTLSYKQIYHYRMHLWHRKGKIYLHH